MKSSVMFGLLCVLSTIPYAQADSTTPAWNDQIIKDFSKNSKSIEFSVGYLANQLTSNTNDKIKSNGTGLRIGKTFNLSPDINTTTSLAGSYLTMKPDNGDISPDFAVNGNISEIGLSQRLSVDLSSSGAIIRPFVEVGFSRGLIATKYTGVDNFSADINYNKYVGAAGLQVVFDNIVPFVMYDYSKIKTDKSFHSQGTVDGVSFTKEVAFETDADRKLSSHTLTIGIGFLF
jgi:opacity protein-like surface antigen